MAVKRIYLSPSNQEHNNGVVGYNEEKQMHILGERVASYLKRSPMFYTRLSNPSWDLKAVVKDSNDWGSDLHICLHSDAGPESAKGTTVFFYKPGGVGERFARLLYANVALISPGADRGVKARENLYELNSTKAPAVLIENFFHTNLQETKHYLDNIDKYAKAISEAVYEFYDVPFEQQRSIAIEQKAIMQSKWKLSDPQSVWYLLDQHPFAETLYKKIADSYK